MEKHDHNKTEFKEVVRVFVRISTQSEMALIIFSSWMKKEKQKQKLIFLNINHAKTEEMFLRKKDNIFNFFISHLQHEKKP